MNILGLNYFFHDSTACLVVDGKLSGVPGLPNTSFNVIRK